MCGSEAHWAHERPEFGHLDSVHLELNNAVLVVFGFLAINAGAGLVTCAYQALSWIRKRRAGRIEEAFASGRLTVPTSWVREARRQR